MGAPEGHDLSAVHKGFPEAIHGEVDFVVHDRGLHDLTYSTTSVVVHRPFQETMTNHPPLVSLRSDPSDFVPIKTTFCFRDQQKAKILCHGGGFENQEDSKGQA